MLVWTPVWAREWMLEPPRASRLAPELVTWKVLSGWPGGPPTPEEHFRPDGTGLLRDLERPIRGRVLQLEPTGLEPTARVARGVSDPSRQDFVFDSDRSDKPEWGLR